MAKRTGNVVALRPNAETIESASRRFLVERDLAPTTRRVYGLTLDAFADALGPDTLLSDVTNVQLADHLATRYASATPATFNRQVATLGSFFAWAGRQRLITADPSEGLERRRERRTARQADTARAIPYADLEALWGRKDIALREKLLWRLLYGRFAFQRGVTVASRSQLGLPA